MRRSYIGLGVGLSVSLLALWHFGTAELPNREAPTTRASFGSEPTHRSPHIHAARPVASASESFDLDDVMKRSHFAFESLDAGFVGGDATYRVRVAGRTIEIAPDASSAKQTSSVEPRPLTIQTVSVQRSHAMPASPSAYEREEDGTLSAAIDDDTTEVVANGTAGLEQSWRFEQTPHGTGDLAVAIDVTGEDFVAQTDSGIHFSDAQSGLGLVYGGARWVDANGRTTDLSLRYAGHRIEIEVPSDLLETSAYPAVLDPTVGAEYSVDAPIIGPAADVQRAPAIGHPGTFNAEYTVVWQDRRRSLGMNYDIYMATVDRTGRVLSPVGALVTPLTDGSDHIAPDIYDHIVVYAAIDTTGFYGVFAKDLTSQKAATEIVAPSGTTDCSTPRIAGNYDIGAGYVYAIVWRELARSGGNGMIASKTINLDLSDHRGRQPLTNTAYDASLPAISGQASINGPKFLAVWSDKSTGVYNIRGDVLNLDGSINSTTRNITNETPSTSANATRPSVATFGGVSTPYDGFIVTWERDAIPFNRYQLSNSNIYAEYVASGGALGAPLAITNSFAWEVSPGVAGYGTHNGTANTEVLIGWSDGTDSWAVHATRLTATPTTNIIPTLSIVDPANYKFTSYADTSTSIAAHSDPNGGYFVAWSDYRNSAYTDIYGGNLPFTAAPSTASVATLSSFLISSSANTETSPSIARCGTTYLAVWTDSRQRGADDYDVYGVRLGSNGAPIGSSFAISTAAGAQDSAVVTCSKSTGTFFVAWVDRRNGNADIYGTQVTAAGVVTSPSAIPLATSTDSETYPALAADNAGRVWLTYNDGQEAIWGTELTADGTVLLPGEPLITDGTNADIDFDPSGGGFLIVYQWFQTLSKSFDIVGAPMTPGGSVGLPFAIEQNVANQRYPQVRFDSAGATATVVYEDDRNASVTHTDVYGRRVNTTSTLGSAIPVATSIANDYRPRLTTRSGALQEVTYYTIDTNVPAEYDVGGVSLNAGTVVGAPFAVSARAGVREMTPAVACSTVTSCVAAYRSYDPNDTTGADRIKARLLSY